MGRYILNEKGEPVEEPDLMKWAMAFEKVTKRVDRTKVGDYEVSTVFLGLDHGWNSDIPILWETMVFYAPNEDIYDSADMNRCGGSREQAEAMHRDMVKKWKEKLP